MSIVCRILVFSGCWLGLVLSAQAQKWEIGGLIGGSNYQGDLARNIVLKETRPAGGIFYKHNFNNYWSWRPTLMYGEIGGTDNNFEEYKYRNLNFRSDIWEFSNIIEFNYLPFGAKVLTSDFSSYVFTGVSLLHFDPEAEFNGNYVRLHPLRTEGQQGNDHYSLWQITIPIGGGVKYALSKNWVLGWELGFRKTFTDYLDDVSTRYPDPVKQVNTFGQQSYQFSDRSREVPGVPEPLAKGGDMRGDPSLKDWYIITAFSISYRITPIMCWPRK
jgi:hypothetical protein